MVTESEGISVRMEGLSAKALTIIEEYFDGKRQGTDMVDAALNLMGKAIQVRHQDRLAKQIDRGQNLRTAQFILEDPEAKRRYIAAMHPEVLPFLPSKVGTVKQLEGRPAKK